jgi:uracil-DNA glycosylase
MTLMDDRVSNSQDARRILIQRLESLQLAGVEQVGKFSAVASLPLGDAEGHRRAASVGEGVPSALANVTTLTPAHSRTEKEPLPPAAPLVSLSPSRPHPHAPAPSMLSSLVQPYPTGLPDSVAERQVLLSAVNAEVRACTLCRELACSRKQTVFGVGNAKPRVVFFGEAPGADEDRQGEPFVGRAGQLLTKIIEACGWQRSDVYIMNVLKCRPPENRNPSPSETENCRPFFERQLEILRPEYIVCVGTVPAQALLETAESVGKLRGRFHRYRDSTVLVTYHPSYLLRNPAAKKYVWDDMQMLLKEMGLPIPKRGG